MLELIIDIFVSELSFFVQNKEIDNNVLFMTTQGGGPGIRRNSRGLDKVLPACETVCQKCETKGHYSKA